MYHSLSLSLYFCLSSLHVTLSKILILVTTKTTPHLTFQYPQHALVPTHPFLALYYIYIYNRSQFISFLSCYESPRCNPNLSSFSSGLFSPWHPSTRVWILFLWFYLPMYAKYMSFLAFLTDLSHMNVLILVRKAFFFLCF